MGQSSRCFAMSQRFPRRLPWIVLAAWIAIAGLAAFESWPYVPRSAVGILLFMVVAPPVYLLAEFASDGFWQTNVGRRISSHPSSFVRMGVGVLFGAAIVGVGSLLSSFA